MKNAKYFYNQGPQGPQGVQGEKGPQGEGYPGPKVIMTIFTEKFISWKQNVSVQ